MSARICSSPARGRIVCGQFCLWQTGVAFVLTGFWNSLALDAIWLAFDAIGFAGNAFLLAAGVAALACGLEFCAGLVE